MKQKTITIIVPCYDEEATLQPFIEEILKVQAQLPEVFIELLFVDDGSKDQTLMEIRKLKNTFTDRINYLSFSRNFGKEAAIIAGLDYAQGEWVALMDADLQDPPGLLVQMYQMITQDHHDVVVAYRQGREGEPMIRSYFSNVFYKLYNRIAEVKLIEGSRDYRLMTRQVVEAVKSLPEHHRFSKGIFSWVGFDTAYIPFHHVDRSAGTTSWSFASLFQYALEGIISFSDVPLTFASYIGLISFVVAFIFGLLIIIKTLIFGADLPGWPSLAVLVLGLGGLQLLSLGMIGKYISKIYIQSKHRPLYIVKEANYGQASDDVPINASDDNPDPLGKA